MSESSRPWKQTLLLAVCFAVAALVAYWPSLRGGFIWDDPEYVVNNPHLRSFRGLVTIWSNIFSLPQWYPLVHTTYWIEFQTYHALGLGEQAGLWPLGYKLVNLALHVATAVLLWRLLVRLAVPGALLAAAIFLLHPVHVESVAWITERKNALSGFLYIAAFIAFLRSKARESDRSFSVDVWYVTALVLFLAALLSKTVTATLPAAVLVVIWWKAGRISRRDVVALAPFFVFGAIMGSITAYLERTSVGATGAEWDYAPTALGELAARTIIAGKAAWFYVGKLIWPTNLAFLYERWQIDSRNVLQWLYPAGWLIAVASLVLARRRIGRGPLAAVLIFGGTLLPALGFFNVYPHRYSFVADHFQHLASIALTTLLAAGIWTAMGNVSARRAVLVAVSAILAVLTFRQSRIYESRETLWADTLEKSPQQWAAYTNLGFARFDEGRIDDAIALHEKALQLAPQVGDTWFNIGSVRARQERWDEAEAAFKKAAELAAKNRPGFSVELDAMNSLGQIAFNRRNDAAAAEALYRRAIALRPDYPGTYLSYAILLDRTGRRPEAFDMYVTAVERMPANFEAHYNLGLVLLELRQPGEAVQMLEQAVMINPKSAAAWTNLGAAQLSVRERGKARFAFEKALSIDPNLEPAQRGLAATK